MSLVLLCSSAGHHNPPKWRNMQKCTHAVFSFWLPIFFSFSASPSRTICFCFEPWEIKDPSKKHIIKSSFYTFPFSQSLTEAPSHVIAFKLSHRKYERYSLSLYSPSLYFKPDNHLMAAQQKPINNWSCDHFGDDVFFFLGFFFLFFFFYIFLELKWDVFLLIIKWVK